MSGGLTERIFQLMLYVLCNLMGVLSCAIDIVSLAPKFSVAILEFYLTPPLVNHKTAFPF